MNKQKAKELLPIIKAFSEGKTIEFSRLNLEDWNVCENPEFMDYNKYRIKPEPKLVPFTFEDNLCGKVIVTKDNNNRAIIVGQMQNGVYTGTRTTITTYSELLKNFELEDGSFCGKYITE